MKASVLICDIWTKTYNKGNINFPLKHTFAKNKL